MCHFSHVDSIHDPPGQNVALGCASYSTVIIHRGSRSLQSGNHADLQLFQSANRSRNAPRGVEFGFRGITSERGGMPVTIVYILERPSAAAGATICRDA